MGLFNSLNDLGKLLSAAPGLRELTAGGAPVSVMRTLSQSPCSTFASANSAAS